MLRHEDVVQDERLAAGAGEPQYPPVIDDFDLGERHQQIGNRARIPRLAEKDAKDRPLRIIAAARKRKMAGHAPAACYRFRDGTRRKR
jgi:hypothetical protein